MQKEAKEAPGVLWTANFAANRKKAQMDQVALLQEAEEAPGVLWTVNFVANRRKERILPHNPRWKNCSAEVCRLPGR